MAGLRECESVMNAREEASEARGRLSAFTQAMDACEQVRAQWAKVHSVAPLAAAQCFNEIRQLHLNEITKGLFKEQP